MPTYRPDWFDPRLHSWKEIAQTMCQSEVVHEIIAVLSFAGFRRDKIWSISGFHYYFHCICRNGFDFCNYAAV